MAKRRPWDDPSGDPFVAWEGAPITVGRDIAVSEMVDRLAEVEADAIRGVTSREGIRGELGTPLVETPDGGAELYRFGAIADREVRPFIYLAYFDWVARAERPDARYLLVSYDLEGTVVDLDSAVEGLRAVVDHFGEGTRERLYTETDGTLLFESGEWPAEEAPRAPGAPNLSRWNTESRAQSLVSSPAEDLGSRRSADGSREHAGRGRGHHGIRTDVRRR